LILLENFILLVAGNFFGGSSLFNYFVTSCNDTLIRKTASLVMNFFGTRDDAIPSSVVEL